MKALIQKIKGLFRKRPKGVFVEVFLDYGFGRMEDASRGDGAFRPCLHITDLTLGEVQKALHGKRFDWHIIHSHWRHYLEIEGFYAAKWDEVQQYLRGDS